MIFQHTTKLSIQLVSSVPFFNGCNGYSSRWLSVDRCVGYGFDGSLRHVAGTLGGS